MTSVAKTIFKNAIWLSLAEIASGVLLFILTVFLAKYLGVESYGKLTFAISFATLFSVIVDFGLGTLAIREIARDQSQAKRFLNNILSLRLILGVVFLILMILAVFIQSEEPIIIKLVALISINVVLNNLIQSFNSVFRAYERMSFEAVGKLILSIFLVGLGLLFIKFDRTLVYFGWIYPLSAFISLIYIFFIAWSRFFHFRFGFDLAFWKFLLKESWPFALSIIFISIYYYLDLVMLGFMEQDTAVGWYGADYKIVLFLLIFSTVMVSVLYPKISYFYKQSREKLKVLLSNFAKLMISVSIPLAFGGMILGDQIINLIFGSEYLGGALAFKILIWTVAIIYISVVFGNTLQACDRQKIYLAGVGLGALVNIILNLILIPKFSLNGAAIATLTTEIIVLIFMLYQLRKIVFIPLAKFFLKPIFASIIMSAIIIVLNDLNVLLNILIGAVSYIVCLIITRGIAKNELIFLKSLMPKKEVINNE